MARKYSKSNKKKIGKLTKDTRSFVGNTLVFIKKTRVRSWKAVFILAFAIGSIVALIWLVIWRIETSSKASGAVLILSTDDDSISKNDNFEAVISLNTNGNDVVATRAIVSYDPSIFELKSWDTSNSVFAADNKCVYNGKACEIVDSDAANGKISITLSKPSPGVDTKSGVIAILSFKALKETSPTSPNITLNFSSPGNYEDSDAISDDGSGTDILQNVTNIKLNVVAPVCTDFKYNPWSSCKDGWQTRTVKTQLPEGCAGGKPVIKKKCGAKVCKYTYTSWSACKDKKQTRKVKTKLPKGCTVGKPVLEKGCNVPVCTGFTYADWSSCKDGMQTREILTKTPEGCTGGDPIVEMDCDNECTDFTYSDWGTCQSDGMQTRTVASSQPDGCTGGDPVISQSCSFVVQEDDKNDEEDEEEKKKDKEDPKFTDLPLFLNKNRGDMVWWKAKDNEKVHHYRYKFNGAEVKTKKAHFYIPVSTPRGIYLATVYAYDKAGNRVKRIVTIRVR